MSDANALQLYKSYYFNFSIHLDAEWHHGKSQTELKDAVDMACGNGSFDAFLSKGGAIEYPIYGVPAAGGSMWVEDALSAADAKEKVQRLNMAATERYSPLGDSIAIVLEGKMHGMWGHVPPAQVSRAAAQTMSDDMAITILEQQGRRVLNMQQGVDIIELAAEALNTEIQFGPYDENKLNRLARLVLLTATDGDLSEILALADNETVAKALKDGAIGVNEVIPFSTYLRAFDAFAKGEYALEDLSKDCQDVLIRDFVSIKTDAIGGMKLIEAAKSECQRIGEKLDLDRSGTGRFGRTG